MKFIGWLFGVALALLLIVFAVSNGASVSLRFEPFPYAIDLPIYAVAFTALVGGFACGGFVAWLGGMKWRRRARRAESELGKKARESSNALLLDAPAIAPSATLPTPHQPPRPD
jgi:uncharacterized integral membrane protein